MRDASDALKAYLATPAAAGALHADLYTVTTPAGTLYLTNHDAAITVVSRVDGLSHTFTPRVIRRTRLRSTVGSENAGAEITIAPPFDAGTYTPPAVDPIWSDAGLPDLLASLADLVQNHLPGNVSVQPLELTLLEVGYGSESAVSAVLVSLADLVHNHLA